MLDIQPKFTSNEEVVEKIINEKVKNEYESRVDEANKTKEEYKRKYEEVEKKYEEATRLTEYKKKYEDENKQSAKDDSGKILDATNKIKEQIVTQEAADCPTCHKHKIKITGLTAKCVGLHCGNEYVIVPKNADHKCTNCGIPIKKSDELTACPFCSSESAKPHDWDRIKLHSHK